MRRALAVVALPFIAISANVLPAQAEDNCSDDAVYCDDAAEFRLDLPSGFRALPKEQQSAEIAAHLIWDRTSAKASCPIVSETHVPTAHKKEFDFTRERWENMFLRAGFTDINGWVMNSRKSGARHDREASSDKFQISLVYVQFKYNGQPFEAWQAAYWKKAELDGAKPVSSRIYFLNCTRSIDARLAAEPRRTEVPISQLFKTFTPTVCKAESDKSPCPDAAGRVTVDILADADGPVATPVDEQTMVLMNAGAKAAIGAVQWGRAH